MQVCGSTDKSDKLLLCDADPPCSTACHTFCCDPPLKAVPKGDWFCVGCTARKAQAAGPVAAPAAGPSKLADAETRKLKLQVRVVMIK